MEGKVGFEPTTDRLTADCSAFELLTHISEFCIADYLSLNT